MVSDSTENEQTTSPEADDRRRSQRAPARLLVEYESVEDFLIDYTANMSLGGMFIQTREPLPVGSRFRLRFRIPGRPEPVETEGEVCWTLTVEEAGSWQPGMGVKLDQLREEDREAVSRLLEAWQ